MLPSPPKRSWACGGANLTSKDFKEVLGGDPWVPVVKTEPGKGAGESVTGPGGFSRGWVPPCITPPARCRPFLAPSPRHTRPWHGRARYAGMVDDLNKHYSGEKGSEQDTELCPFTAFAYAPPPRAPAPRHPALASAALPAWPSVPLTVACPCDAGTGGESSRTAEG